MRRGVKHGGNVYLGRERLGDALEIIIVSAQDPPYALILWYASIFYYLS